MNHANLYSLSMIALGSHNFVENMGCERNEMLNGWIVALWSFVCLQ